MTIGIRDSQLALENVYDPSLNGLIGCSIPPFAGISTVSITARLLVGVNINYGGDKVSDWWVSLETIATPPTSFEMGIYQNGVLAASNTNVAGLITGSTPAAVEIPLAFQGGAVPTAVVFLIPDNGDLGSFSLFSSAGGGVTNNLGPAAKNVGLNSPSSPGFQASGVSALPADLTKAGITFSTLNQLLIGWS